MAALYPGETLPRPAPRSAGKPPEMDGWSNRHIFHPLARRLAAGLAPTAVSPNMVSVGGRMHALEDLTRFVELFLATPYSHEERHTRRIGLLADYERTGNLPPLPASASGHGSASG